MSGVKYTFEVGEWIANQYALGARIADLYQCHPERCPHPVTVSRWRKKYGQFDLLMIEAEQVRAEYLADDALRIADDPSKSAARARNAIRTRQWLAERLDRDRYGQQQKVNVDHSGVIDVRHSHTLTRDQLVTIALGGVIEVKAGNVIEAGQVDAIPDDQARTDTHEHGVSRAATPTPPATVQASPPMLSLPGTSPGRTTQPKKILPKIFSEKKEQDSELVKPIRNPLP